jgi:hypothetical protein
MAAEKSAWELIEGLSSLPILLLIAAIIVVFGGVFFQSHVEASSRAGSGTQFSEVSLVTLLKQFDVTGTVPEELAVPAFYVEPGFYIVAFDKDDARIHDNCAKVDIERPRECSSGKACVCLCLEGNVCKDHLPSCASFNNIKHITANINNENFVGGADDTKYYQVVIYGKCGSWNLRTKLAPAPLYIYADQSDSSNRTVVLDDFHKITMMNFGQNQT